MVQCSQKKKKKFEEAKGGYVIHYFLRPPNFQHKTFAEKPVAQGLCFLSSI